MPRWLLLFALIKTLASTRTWWCTGEKHEAIDHMPTFSTAEEVRLMKMQQQVAAAQTQAEARARGKGPRVTQLLVEDAMRRVRDEAHDRVHRRVLDEQREGEAEVAEPIPAAVAERLSRQAKENNGRD